MTNKIIDPKRLAFLAIIRSSNEDYENSEYDEGSIIDINQTFYFMRRIWYFLHSDYATYEGNEVKKIYRGYFVNQPSDTLEGKFDWNKFKNAKITYDSRENNVKIKEGDFVDSVIEWIGEQNPVNITDKRKFREFKEFLELKKIQANNPETAISNFTHPKYNPNFGSKETFELYKYLFDNYYNANGIRSSKVKLLNIWFYIRDYDSSKYSINLTKEEYFSFIKDNYNVTITNKKKSDFKYEEKEKPSMNNHRIEYEDSLK